MSVDSDESIVNVDESEPADPSAVRINGSERREVRIASRSLKPSRLPTPLIECGCGECTESLVDPLAESEETVYAANHCPSPQPMTVKRASEAYLRYQRAAWNRPADTSTYERALETYAGLLEADRQLRRDYDGLTTVMITRRLSPLDDNGGWLPPIAIDSQLQDSAAKRSFTRSIRYHLRGFEFEYLGVTATTDSAATPHEHVLVWIEDPDDTIGVNDVAPALAKHVEKVPNAYEDDHEYADDGSTGAITVRHDPPLVDHVPERMSAVFAESEAVEEGQSPTDGDRVPVNTAGAQYLASQLPHLAIGDVFESERTVDDVQLDGGAIAWASPWKWRRSSSGIDL